MPRNTRMEFLVVANHVMSPGGRRADNARLNAGTGADMINA
jgi:hypothetical protein